MQPGEQQPRIVSRIGLILGPLLFTAPFILSLPEISDVPLTLQLRATMGLALWMAAWWLTEALPLAVTSLLPLVALPLFGVLSPAKVTPNYFDDVIVLFFGGFCLALAMEKCGLHRRIALRVVRIFGTKPRNVVLGLMVASALISMWVSNTATALMLLPVATTVSAFLIGKSGGERTKSERNFAAACVLAVAIGASLGGIGSLIGTPPNANLKEYYNHKSLSAGLIAADQLPALTFGSWMIFAVPVVIVLVPLAWLILTRVAMRVPRALEGDGKRDIAAALGTSGRVAPSEILVMVIFFLTVFAWITHARIDIGGVTVPFTGWDGSFAFNGAATFITDGVIAAIAAVLLFALPTLGGKGDRLLTWEFAGSRLPFDVLLLFGGGLALAAGFKESGLDRYIMSSFKGLAGAHPALVVLAVVALMAVISEFASNLAAAAMAMPILDPLGRALGMGPLTLLVAGTLGASCGYALPVATPPNAVAFGSGKVTMGQMVRNGLALDVIAVLVMAAAVIWLAPLVL
ncbi:MAG: anion permease [Planctomycetes bacterium]|nr:anion permease [Planctomycetota bacterium]NUQ34523.1 anion permease [Planctomycetaceae bacterium]